MKILVFKLTFRCHSDAILDMRTKISTYKMVIASTSCDRGALVTNIDVGVLLVS